MELGIGLTKIIPIVVYFCGIGVLITAIFYKIEFGLFFIVPLLALQDIMDSIQAYPLGKDFMDIFFLLLVIKAAKTQFEIDENAQWRKQLNIVVIGFIVWSHFTLWVGAHHTGSGIPIDLGDVRFIEWKNFIMLPILYFVLIRTIQDKRQVKIILVLMTLTMLFMDRKFYNNFSGKDTSHFSHDIRVGTSFSYLGPNETAVFYAQNTIVILCLFLHDPNVRRRLLFGVTTIFNYYCLLFLFSRGGYLATLICWSFLGLVKDRRILAALVLFGIFWRSLVPAAVEQRIDMASRENDDGMEVTEGSIDDRFDMWNQATALISQSPLVGYGYAMTPFLKISTGDHKRRSLHNGYLELMVEQGIVGMVIMLGLFVMGIRLGWRLYRTTEDPFYKGFGLGYVGCVLAVMAGNLAGSYLFYFNVSSFFWVNLALILRCLEMDAADKLKKAKKDDVDGEDSEKQNGLDKPRIARKPKLRRLRPLQEVAKPHFV